MKNTIIFTLILAIAGAVSAADRVPAHPHYRISTSEGDFVVELDGRRAPITVGNFVQLVESGYYTGTVFHRVMPGFMIQAGGYTTALKSKEPDERIPNESGNGLSNSRGTIAMARQEEPHTAAAQFYINLIDNRGLDPSPNRWGYTVFGMVIEGMEIVDKIAAVQTGPGGQFSKDVPLVPIIINEVARVTYD
jgi:peptidyl-prolyl cis-trans isomerase A (cyclophilin A)